MVRPVVSRSQRRLEKKQALVLLVLVLAVSLVSFTLGVMVGRSGSRSEAAATPADPTRLPVAQAAPEAKADETPAATPPQAENLTFYDSLPKGEQPPLGSGINLPPQSKPEKPVEDRTSPVAKAAAAPAATAPPAVSPPPAANGAYLVQAASFRQQEDAQSLRERLAKKGYAAHVESADLGDKGVWHRVYVGPFASAEAAAGVVGRLKAEEKLSALVKKR